MFSLEVKRDKVLDDINYHAKYAGARFRQKFRPSVLNELRVKLMTEPGPPRYPLRWTSERQRRFVMAKLRRENNLPYRRTHRFVQSWKIERINGADEVIIKVYHPSEVEQFITGVNQQGFHQDTGWYDAKNVIAEAAIKLDGQAIAYWENVAAL